MEIPNYRVLQESFQRGAIVRFDPKARQRAKAFPCLQSDLGHNRSVCCHRILYVQEKVGGKER